MPTPVYQRLFFGGAVVPGTPQSFTLEAGYRSRIDAVVVVCDAEDESVSVEFLSALTGVPWLYLFNLESPLSYLTNPRLVIPDGDTTIISATGETCSVWVSGISLTLP
jgi:hypothetical protein